MELLPLYQLAIAVGLGLLVGLQREWADSQVAGIRTFPIIALLGCMSGLVAEQFGGWVVAGGLIALGVIVLAAKSLVSENHAAETTTQVACLLVYVANSGLAVGFVTEAVVVCGALAALLHWKSKLHDFAHRIGREELHAVVQMSLIALVILPILPNQTFGPYAVINPFEIWLMVVLIVGISLAAYVISRLVSAKKGTLLAGILGGLISSTATTVSCARRSRDSQIAVRVSAAIILVSMPVVFARVLFEVAVVAPEILETTLPPLAIVMLVMVVMAWFSFRGCTS